MKKIFTIRRLDQQQAHMWGNHVIEDEVSACSNRNIVEHFLKNLPKGEPILEAGCGLGAWVVFLSEKGYDISGIDHDEKVIERLKGWKPSLKVSSGDISRLPYGDNFFGAYISLGVVEHFEEGCEEALKEAYRVLKPGGLIFLTVPLENIFRKIFAHPLRSLYLILHKLRGDTIHFAEYRYSEIEACKMIENAGFQIFETDMDDFISRSRSLSLWSEFPFLQSNREPYGLNIVGKIIAYSVNSISNKILAAGILVLARKP